MAGPDWLQAWLPSRRLTARELLSRYLVAWCYLAGFAISELVYLNLSAPAQDSLLGWASTSVDNLRHDPVGSLVASAFVAPDSPWGSLLLISLALFGANRALGNWRLVVVCGAGHVIGTLVSEGIEWWRIAHGQLPASDALLLDVGISYVVVAATVVAIGFGSWPGRAAAVVDLALLIFGAHIFGGLSQLDVPAVGHFTAIVMAITLGFPLAAGYRRAQARPGSGREAEGGDEAADHVLG